MQKNARNVLKMSKYHLLPHKPAARFAMEKILFEVQSSADRLEIVNKIRGAPTIGDIKIHEPKALMLRLEKRTDPKTKVLPCMWYLFLICAPLRKFALLLREFALVFA